MQGQRIRITGLVQGVGFRPNVWRLAHVCGVVGAVNNDSSGVLIEAWGSAEALAEFQQQLRRDVPPLARIDNLIVTPLAAPCPHADFRIVASQSGAVHTSIAPDAAMCNACRADIFDPSNRRFRYPFTNCTHCGPRLSIVCGIPYDRANTSMAGFPLCPPCQQEYANPADRRFHAQPNACPGCGPHVWLEDETGQRLTPATAERDALDTASRFLREAKILAVMGLGGVHLVCDATNDAAVMALRQRKRRYQKPLALMARDVDVIRQYCTVNPAEVELLRSQYAPIVLLERGVEGGSGLSSAIAPAQHHLGFMLPYTPLHALLLETWDSPLVMTSANLSEEPQCISLAETRQRMRGIADYLLLHDRPIINRVDDSVVRVLAGKPRLLRRARGYAPAPLPLPSGFANTPPLLAMGGELKSTFALVRDGTAMLSQHLGDLEALRAWREYERSLALYRQLFAHQPQVIVVDKHPGYRASIAGRLLAKTQGLPLIEAQHHHAHIAACLAENAWPLQGGEVLGIALDGLGYGDDGTLWGGEFLRADYHGYTRLGHFKPTALPGGTQAILQPWRNTWAQLTAVGWEGLAAEFAQLELIRYLQRQPLATLEAMRLRGLNSPLSSSCGRLLDAVAAALGFSRDRISYEGQAAIELEAATADSSPVPGYSLGVQRNTAGLWEIDPAPLWYPLLRDLQTGSPRAVIAARFHHGLVAALAATAARICAEHPAIKAIALSGGVFQNALILRDLPTQLQALRLPILTHNTVPTNDGGLALGQAVIALATCQAKA